MLNYLRGNAAVNVFSFGGVLHCILLQNQFFLRETRDGFEAFSGADQSRAQFFSVHRRPLTGSTAGVTPVVKGAG